MNFLIEILRLIVFFLRFTLKTLSLHLAQLNFAAFIFILREIVMWRELAEVIFYIIWAVLQGVFQLLVSAEGLAALAVLMIPWAISAFLPWLWIFWLVLCNVALWLFLQEIFNVDFFEETRLHWLIFGLNAGALLLWEAFSLRFLWMQKTFAPRLMLVFCAIPAVLMGVIWWWETSHFSPFMYVVWALPTFYFYRFQKRDIFALAIVGFSVMSVLTSGLAKFLFNSNADAASFLVIACAVIGMTSLLARWLKETLRLWQEKAQ